MDGNTLNMPESPFARLGIAASDALTDTMVERLVITATSGMEIVDRLNDPDTKAAVHRLLDGLTTMHTTGSLDTVFEIVALVHAMRAAATDSMVDRLTQFIETMMTNLATQEIAELARDVEGAMYDAGRICATTNQPKSILGVLGALMKPEGVRTLNLLLAVGQSLESRVQRQVRPE